MITKFSDQHEFLSNFFPVNIIVDNIIFPSVEHAYVAAKTDDREKKLLIAYVLTAGKAKKFGKKLILPDNWNDIKVTIMHQLLKEKFNWQLNPELAQKLLDTYPNQLIEGNTWGDKFWGAVFDGTNWNGENNLGILLMKHRELLKTQISFGNGDLIL